MKDQTIQAKADRDTASNQQPAAGPAGASAAPPGYGIDFLDRPKQPNRTGLPDRLKAGVEALSGLSMDDVRVRYNSDKPAQLQALAYTQGAEIHVGPGQEQHLPHEAWHVVQQKQGRVRASYQLKSGIAINDSQQLEHEADLMGGKAQSMSDGYQKPPVSAKSHGGALSTQFQQEGLPALAPCIDNTVIQRQVDTWGGTFSTRKYEAIKENVDGKSVGADILLEFMPNNKCPRNVAIGLIQIVTLEGQEQYSSDLQENLMAQGGPWAVDRAGDANPVYGSYDPPNKENRSKSLVDNPPDETEGNQFGRNGRSKIPATLGDTPVLPLKPNVRQAQRFETTAIILEGSSKGLALGTVSWGWVKEPGDADATLEPLSLVNANGSSANFDQARISWNTLAQTQELVPIPDILAPPAAKKRCFLTTACVEYMGLGDDCDELATLRGFRDGYLVQKPNGASMIELYYEISPRIVTAINQQQNREEILRKMYEIIVECVDAIKNGDNELAYQKYCRLVIQLMEKYA